MAFLKARDKVALGLIGVGGALLAGRAWLRHRRKIDLAGRVVVVTGASSGLGLIVARQAAARGASLVLAARDASELAEAERDLRAAGAADVLVVPTDVTDRAQVDALAARAISHFGRVDVLVNCAGIMLVAPLENVTEDDFRRLMDTNFWGNLYPTLALLPHMRARGFGRIANVVSVGGRMAVPHMLAYTASKFALAGLSEGLRAELADADILVTSVFPGTIRTGGQRHAWFKGDAESEYTWFGLSDVIPGLAISAETCAAKLWDAVLHGDPEVVVGWNAKLGIAFHDLFPDWYAETMSLVARALPSATPDGGAPVQGQHLRGRGPEWLSRMVPPQAKPSSH